MTRMAAAALTDELTARRLPVAATAGSPRCIELTAMSRNEVPLGYLVLRARPVSGSKRRHHVSASLFDQLSQQHGRAAYQLVTVSTWMPALVAMVPPSSVGIRAPP